MKKYYREAFNIENRPVLSKAKCTSQYTVRFGDCPLCGDMGSLMVTDRKPRPWGYCCTCQESRSLHWLDKRSNHQAIKQMILWQYWQHCRKALDTHSLPVKLRKTWGMPRSPEEPINKYFFRNFLGWCDCVTFKYLLKMEGIRTVKNLDFLTEDTLITPIQSSPGFIIGFCLYGSDGEAHIVKLKRYEDEDSYMYPNLSKTYTCKDYEGMDSFIEEGALPICMGGLFNVALPTA